MLIVSKHMHCDPGSVRKLCRRPQLYQEHHMHSRYGCERFYVLSVESCLQDMVTKVGHQVEVVEMRKHHVPAAARMLAQAFSEAIDAAPYRRFLLRQVTDYLIEALTVPDACLILLALEVDHPPDDGQGSNLDDVTVLAADQSVTASGLFPPCVRRCSSSCHPGHCVDRTEDSVSATKRTCRQRRSSRWSQGGRGQHLVIFVEVEVQRHVTPTSRHRVVSVKHGSGPRETAPRHCIVPAPCL